MKYVIGLLMLTVLITASANATYKVDKAVRAADVIVLGEVYKVEMIDDKGALISDLRTHATRENRYKVRNHIRIIETIYGTPRASNEFIIERPTPAYHGKETLRKGLKLFYFLKNDGKPIDGKYEFQTDRRTRIMKKLKTKT